MGLPVILLQNRDTGVPQTHRPSSARRQNAPISQALDRVGRAPASVCHQFDDLGGERNVGCNDRSGSSAACDVASVETILGRRG
jgi:hypothetical protein